MRLNQAARTFNVGISTISELLAKKGFKIDSNPNTKLTPEQVKLLEKEYKDSADEKREAEELTIGNHKDVVIQSDGRFNPKMEDDFETDFLEEKVDNSPKSVAQPKPKPVEHQPAPSPVIKPEEKKAEEKTVQDDVIRADASVKPRILGKINLDQFNKPKHKPKPEPAENKAERPVAVPPASPAPVVQEAKKEAETPIVAQETPVPETAKVENEQSQQPTAVPVQPEPIAPAPEVPVQQAEPQPAKQEQNKVHPVVEVEPTQPKAVEKVEHPVAKAAPEKAEEKTHAKPHHHERERHPHAKQTPAPQPEKKAAAPVPTPEPEAEPQLIEGRADKLQGLKVIGKIDVDSFSKKPSRKPVASSDDRKADDRKKKKRKRIKREEGAKPVAETTTSTPQQPNARKEKEGGAHGDSPRTPAASGNGGGVGRPVTSNNTASTNNNNNSNNKAKNKKKGANDRSPRREAVSDKEVDDSYRKTMAKLGGGAQPARGGKGKYRKEKREAQAAKAAELRASEDQMALKVTEFISANELAVLMDVSINELIAKFMEVGMFVSINQRLDAEAITMVAEEFGFTVDFASVEEEIDMMLAEEEDAPEDLSPRAPIVTIMGHVDHGKTSLLDYIRKTKVAAGEAGGITQHIGAYDVTTESGRRIVFLDTPGHEAFTAMRARGAKVTDVVVIVIAADDNVMPQTVEAINHAQIAGVPIVIAINKIDKPTANPNKIKEQLANQVNILVEEWGGKVQCQEISAKSGLGVDELLEMVLLESDILELKANPDRAATGTVIEASLDKGKGYMSTILVQNGTLKVGDVILAGHHFGKVRAMYDSRLQRVKVVGPSSPVQVLGLNGAPQAGDKMNVMPSDREAREIAGKREQILREQSIRATKRTTLSDIGKRIALGNYHQLNILIKGDVDGSVEALTDSLQRLSRDEVEVKIIYKAVGPISENDILLASASEAIVIGFQVRPSQTVRKLAEKENVEIRLYSIIYQAIDDVKKAMEGLLSPDIEETIVGNVVVRDVFKISKVGSVAGCYVTDGYIKRNSKIRVIRDGIVVYGGESGGEVLALKRFKDDVSEVKQNFECGISIKNFNDIKVDDVIEVFELKEVKRLLS